MNNIREVVIIPATKEDTSEQQALERFSLLGLRTSKKRVAAYCRVSTTLENQQGSYKSQKKYYEQMIHDSPNWELVKVYGDEGGSGTSRKNRPGFNAMMNDAINGKIDLILTKSISRFSRNHRDTIDCIGKLNALNPPVEVFFENEQLSSRNPNAIFAFTILAMIAQEQSRSISENVRHGIEHMYEMGETPYNIAELYGFMEDEEGEIVENKVEADIIREIFTRFDSGEPVYNIVSDLKRRGVRTRRGVEISSYWVWSKLRNEKYMGAVICPKTYKPHILSEKIVENKGQIKTYQIKKHHTAIIPSDLWERVRYREQLIESFQFYKNIKVNVGRIITPRVALFEEIYLLDADQDRKRRKKIELKRRGFSGVLGENADEYYCATNYICKKTGFKLSEIGIEQTFMEAVYSLKRHMNGEDALDQLNKEFMKIYRSRRGRVKNKELRQIEEQIKALQQMKRSVEDEITHYKGIAEAVKVFTSNIQQIGQEICELKDDLQKKRDLLHQVEEQRRLYRSFVEDIMALPDSYDAVHTLKINGLDLKGSYFVDIEGKRKWKDKQGPNAKYTVYTEDVLQQAPDFLIFDPIFYEKYIESATVIGDSIVFKTKFGTEILGKHYNRGRCDCFLGFRYTEAIGKSRLFRTVQELARFVYMKRQEEYQQKKAAYKLQLIQYAESIGLNIPNGETMDIYELGNWIIMGGERKLEWPKCPECGSMVVTSNTGKPRQYCCSLCKDRNRNRRVNRLKKEQRKEGI